MLTIINNSFLTKRKTVVPKYGSMFQAWATSKVLQRLDLSKPSPKRRKKNLIQKTSENNIII